MKIQCLIVLVLSVLAHSSSAGVLTISETEFNDSEWIATVVSGPANGQTATQIADGGNSGTTPDSFRSITTNTSQGVRTAHIDANNDLDPSVGAITGIDYSIDFQNISYFGQGQRVQFLVVQAGSYYVDAGTITGPGGTNWTNLSNSLVAADFTLVSGTSQPDFTTSGSPIMFGFATSNSGGNSIEVGYDNWSATITTVPEAGSLVLLNLSAVVWAIRRRR